jgi:hypothetical protein
MAYFDLENYYRMLFSLQQFHHWNMTMVEEWTPVDREIYVHMLSEHIEEEKTKQKQN